MNDIIQHTVPPTLDLRDMLRQHIIKRSLKFMAQGEERRKKALHNGKINAYCSNIRNAVMNFYGTLPVGKKTPLLTKKVSSFDKKGYRLENVLFDSFPGWQVNATIYVPLDFSPPFPGVIIPVGHSGKQFDSYQLPAQFFARCGYLAVLFDPPGQASEKQIGNDHFVDGVRCYLVGETSSQYFVADALRCVDYLESREDVDLSKGVAMTGVSGGGTTTTLAGLLDDRITVLGPSCCLTKLADLDITQCYAGCPETHPWRRYAEGIDEVDLLCGAFPKALLLMAGEFDEVFRIQDTRKLSEEVAEFYQLGNSRERFQFFVDKYGHGYSLEQAKRFVQFMNRWLLNKPDIVVPDLPEDSFSLDPYTELQCRPRQDVNMRSLTLNKAIKLEETRDKNPGVIRKSVAIIAGVQDKIPIPKSSHNEPFRVWTHYWQQVLLTVEDDIELPATFLYSENIPAKAILHFDDSGRNRLLYRNGLLARAVGFLDKGSSDSQFSVFTVDLRGWGDSTPAMYPYELAGWGGIDRCLAYMSASLGDPLMSMRIRDGLSALEYLRTRREILPDKIVITGSGSGGIVALHVAALDGQVRGLAIWNSLFSFRSLLEAENYPWPADTFIPRVLEYYDLPEIAESISIPICIFNPLDGSGQPISSMPLKSKNENLIYLRTSSEGNIISNIKQIMAQDNR